LKNKLKDYRAGSSFGELALTTGEPRAASVIAKDVSWLITLNKDVYHEIVEMHISRQIERRFNFFKMCPLFVTMSDDDIQKLAQTSHTREFP
jgi:CRP-like cAMP-binding protein